MTEERLISADSHFVEPPSMWVERVDKKFRDRAPHTVKDLGGRGGEWFVCENITPMSVAGFFGAGVPSQDLPAHARKTFERRHPKACGMRSIESRIRTRWRTGRSHLYLDGNAAVQPRRR